MASEFTESARRVLGIAGSIAADRGALAIAPEDILAALVIRGNGLTRRLFAAARLSLENVARELAVDSARYHPWDWPFVDHPQSADVKRVLALAEDEFSELGHTYVGPEHLLLAIVRATDLNVSRIFRDKGIGHEDMRDHLTAFLAPQAEVRQNPYPSQSAQSEDGISLEWISTADHRPTGASQDRPAHAITVEAVPLPRRQQLPRVLREVKPQYSRSASERGVEGNVVLEGVVLPDGSITAIRVFRSLDPELDELAIQVLQQLEPWCTLAAPRLAQPCSHRPSLRLSRCSRKLVWRMNDRVLMLAVLLALACAVVTPVVHAQVNAQDRPVGSFCGRVLSVSCESVRSDAGLIMETPEDGRFLIASVPRALRQDLMTRLGERHGERLVCLSPELTKDPRRRRVTVRRLAQVIVTNETVSSTRDDVASTCEPDVQLPVPLHTVPPKYTAGALDRRITGKVTLLGVVELSGRVTDIRVLESISPDLDDEAVRAFEQWRFRPARRLGQDVATAVWTEFTFRLRMDR